jgi:leucine dehydrogenase
MKITESAITTNNTTMPLASMLANKHEKVIYYYDEPTGLRVIVAIHNTVLGPALGGTRIWNYAREEDALLDVLRLSQGMTYKSAIAGLDLGGGKAVIIGEASKIKTEAFLRRYGRFIEELNGSYVTGPDVNVSMYDLVHVAKETQYVVGLPATQGGSGDPSLLTAYGTYMGLKAAAKIAYGHDSLQGKKIGVEGVGKVGSILVDYLCKEGAKVYITDILPAHLAAITQQYDVQVIESPTALYDLDMDIYAPCALGATINDQTLPRLKCQIIAGAANNQLADESKHGRMLLEKGIVYVPDFVINAGGVINVHTEFYGGYNKELALAQIERIYEVCLDILARSAQENRSSQEVAVRLAEQRIAAMKHARLG